VSELFYLIEQETSPFVIAKKGKVALDAIAKLYPQYVALI